MSLSHERVTPVKFELIGLKLVGMMPTLSTFSPGTNTSQALFQNSLASLRSYYTLT